MYRMISSLIRFFKKKLQVSSWLPYIQIKDAYLLPGFSLRQDEVGKSKRISIGDGSNVAAHFVFESSQGFVSIGNNCHIGQYTIICRSEIVIGDYVTIAWGGYLYDHDSHSIFADDRCKDITTEYKNLQTGKPMISGKNWEIVKSAPIKICSYAWIGMNCIILKGVTIGEGAIVGAGSIVTHDVAPWTLVAGNPAKFIKNLAPHNTY